LLDGFELVLDLVKQCGIDVGERGRASAVDLRGHEGRVRVEWRQNATGSGAKPRSIEDSYGTDASQY